MFFSDCPKRNTCMKVFKMMFKEESVFIGRSVHNSSFSCELCGFKTKTKQAKQDHLIKKHLKEKVNKKFPQKCPDSCPINGCDFETKSKKALIQHITDEHRIFKKYLIEAIGSKSLPNDNTQPNDNKHPNDNKQLNDYKQPNDNKPPNDNKLPRHQQCFVNNLMDAFHLLLYTPDGKEFM